MRAGMALLALDDDAAQLVVESRCLRYVQGNERGSEQRDDFRRSTTHVRLNVCSCTYNCTSHFGSSPMRVRRLQLFARPPRVKSSKLRMGADDRVAKAHQTLFEVRHERTDRQDDAIDAAAPAFFDGGPRFDGRAGQQVRTTGDHLDGCGIAAGLCRGAARHVEQRKSIYLGANRWEKPIAQAAGALG